MQSENLSGLRSLHSSFTIQSRITRHFDRIRLERLKATLATPCHEEDIRRLMDLQDKANQDHTWWQALNPQTDRVLPRTEWVTAMRARLGAPVLPTDGWDLWELRY